MTRIFMTALIALTPLAAMAHTGPELTLAALSDTNTLDLLRERGATIPPLQIVCPLPVEDTGADAVVLACSTD